MFWSLLNKQIAMKKPFLFTGSKYWFICRRIFVEEVSTGQIRYYTSVPQFEELMESLDARYFEADLCHAIECEKSEIDRQMAITERLTNELKANNKKSYLELENRKSLQFPKYVPNMQYNIHFSIL